MIAGTAIACVAVFLIAFSGLRVTQAASGGLAIARGAMTLLSDRTIDDDARERAVRQASIRLFSASASIAVRAVLAMLVSFVPVLIAETAGVATLTDVVAFLSRWDVMVITTLVIVGYVVTKRAWQPST
jgi:hypothetical protein